MIIMDSSFVYALYNAKDSTHTPAKDFATGYKSSTIIPDVVLPEVAYLFTRDVGYQGVQTFLANFIRVSNSLEARQPADLERIHEISIQYGDAEFDVVDCSIMALSERLNIAQVATFDRRDFSIFQPRHCAYLELKP